MPNSNAAKICNPQCGIRRDFLSDDPASMSTPTPLPPKKSSSVLKHLRPSDVRAVVQLATQATRAVARIAEGVHQSVWNTLGAPTGKAADQTRGITGLVYKSIHGVTQLLGAGADQA
jgi:hypothetical protein